eukprot:CAMPEP_0174857298 /NCGR_PEP_ID=MMETSP1114-20130205/38352_1 /TAXON_ID=312471 /ORGANISM="Neobodo designis, Strain CCAP 1951/1" /LENGTH=31 /DNA_ID= /DNA_START= /DNA_END= /DNA_ORIENTATION=
MIPGRQSRAGSRPSAPRRPHPDGRTPRRLLA